MVPLAVLTGVAMMAAWFPFSTLWHQQAAIDATTNQISALARQQRLLESQAHSVSSASVATQLARREYQLVRPGQSLIQVLPGRQSGSPSATSGDPGFQPLVSPSSAPTIGLPSGRTPAAHSSLGAFAQRLVRTLEFWR
jgi:hypothetical protein